MIVVDRKRPQWTEAEVRALPLGEDDRFERKGHVVPDDTLYGKLGQALSAFANARGGGHLILGVRDEGTFDGVAPTKGPTRTREWLEQIIPARCDPPIPDFRVHEVVPAVPSAIPPGTVVLVIDVSESQANHQSTADDRFYQRVGGHSVRFTAQQLEARRVRLTQPALVGRIDRVLPVLAYPHEDGLFLELKIRVFVNNTGPVAAPRWQFVPEGFWRADDAGRETDLVARPDFPSRSRDSFIRKGDRTLLPGVQGDEEVDLGLRLRPRTLDAAGIRAEIDALLPPGMRLQFRVVHDTDAGTSTQEPLDPVLDREALVAAIVKLIPPA
jgi:hypothetical protein